MNDLALPPGWYADHDEPAYLRWWTGTSWSDNRKTRPGLPAGYLQRTNRSHFSQARRIR